MALREIFLTLAEVDSMIRVFEARFKISSAELLCNEEAQATIPEDDLFKWEAYLDHRRELLRVHEQVHRNYLAALSQPQEGAAKTETPEDLLLLAA